MEKCCFKCDDFETSSSRLMANFMLGQSSPEDVITTWYNLTDNYFTLHAETIYDDDETIGDFHLSDILFLYRHNILSRKMYDTANTFVNNFLTDILQDAYNRHWEMVDMSVNINSFHIDLIWED